MMWPRMHYKTTRKTKKITIAGGDARIELATSCTLSKNHTTRPITRVCLHTCRPTELALFFVPEALDLQVDPTYKLG